MLSSWHAFLSIHSDQSLLCDVYGSLRSSISARNPIRSLPNGVPRSHNDRLIVYRLYPRVRGLSVRGGMNQPHICIWHKPWFPHISHLLSVMPEAKDDPFPFFQHLTQRGNSANCLASAHYRVSPYPFLPLLTRPPRGNSVPYCQDPAPLFPRVSMRPIFPSLSTSSAAQLTHMSCLPVHIPPVSVIPGLFPSFHLEKNKTSCSPNGARVSVSIIVDPQVSINRDDLRRR